MNSLNVFYYVYLFDTFNLLLEIHLFTYKLEFLWQEDKLKELTIYIALNVYFRCGCVVLPS